MMNEKKQLVEMGELLKKDTNGKYRASLRQRIIELRETTEVKIKKELDRENALRLEALMRALTIASRILDKVFVSEPHVMSSSSRAV